METISVITIFGISVLIGYFFSRPQKPGIDELIDRVEFWARQRGIFMNSTPKDQALKTVSEVGEFADNVLRRVPGYRIQRD